MHEKRIEISLLLMRLSVFLVMVMWTVDKFVRPEHAIKVYEHFYGLGGLGSSVMYTIAALEMVLLVGFLVGFKKRFTYGLVLVLHAISTLSSYQQYLNPFGEGPNLLFYAAWPMLAACFALYVLRDLDTLFAVER